MKKIVNTASFLFLVVFSLAFSNPLAPTAVCDDIKVVRVLENNQWWIYVYNSNGELIDKYPSAE